jgi:hypothetical protein
MARIWGARIRTWRKWFEHTQPLDISRLLSHIYSPSSLSLSITKIELCDSVWSISLLKEIKNCMKSRSQPHFHLFFSLLYTNTQAVRSQSWLSRQAAFCTCVHRGVYTPCHATCHISKNILLHKSPNNNWKFFFYRNAFKINIKYVHVYT